MTENLRKDYVLVSSDARNALSASTTDFTVSLAIPLLNVIRTDVVQIIMEYNVPNIAAPNNAFVIEGGISQSISSVYKGFPVGSYSSTQHVESTLAYILGAKYTVSSVDDTLTVSVNAMTDARLTFTVTSPSLRDVLGMSSPTLTSQQVLGVTPAGNKQQWVFPNTVLGGSEVEPDNGSYPFLDVQELTETVITTPVTIEDGLYTPAMVAEILADRLPGYTVQASTANIITMERILTADSLDETGNSNELIVTSAVLRGVLGLKEERLKPTFNGNIGDHGSFKWVFPRPMKLTQTPPYLLLQSRELGNKILSATGDASYFRLLLVETKNGFVFATNERVDTYKEAPRTIKDIDIRLILPNKTIVDNLGGSLTLLLEVVRSV